MSTKLKSYSTTPGSNNAAPPDGWPEGMLPSGVNNSARELMARLAEWYQDAEWLLRNDTVTGFTASTIIITGNVTSRYTVDRAIRLDESNSKLGIITASSFAAGSTTVTITGYTILATPTALELGVIDSSKNALVTIRGAQTVQGAKTFSSAVAMSGAAINTAVRVDVASAATVDLDAVAANNANITGTTPVTAFTLTNGRTRNCRCDAALPITTGASLLINGVASGTTITFAAGDTFEAWGEPSGVVRIVSLTRVGGGADGLLSTTTSSAAAQADIVLPSGYRNYEIEYDLTVSSDAAVIDLRISTDGGSTFKSGATDYEYATVYNTSSAVGADSGNTGANAIRLVSTGAGIGSAAAEGMAGTVKIFHPASTTRHKLINFHHSVWDATATPLLTNWNGSGSYNTDANAIDAVRFLPSAGTITGTFKLYGRA